MKHLFEDGRFAIGVNYWASHAATEMWSNWSSETVRRDFETMRRYGIEIVRCFPLWPDFQPIKLLKLADGTPGGRPAEVRMGEKMLPDTFAGQCGMDEVMLERFRELCDIARENGIKLIVPLLTGHMTARLFVPPALEGLDLYTHPLALKYEVKFIRCFVETMKDHDAIIAWESGNETNFLSHAPEPAAAWSWTALIHGTIRAADPLRPVIGVSVMALEDTPKSHWLIRDQAELSDILAGHPYSLWNPVFGREPFRSFRNLHHAALETRLLADIGGRPAFIEETGTWRPMTSSGRELADGVGNILWNLYQENGRALLWWCAFDQTHIDVAPYDWPFMGLEHGVFTVDGEAHPIAEKLLGFRNFLDLLPFGALPERKADAVCIVNDLESAFGVFLTARQAKINLRFRHSAQKLESAKCYFLPSANRRAGLTTNAWHELLGRVCEGATLYLSLDDTILDGLAEATGCRVLDREEVNDVVRFGAFTLPRKIRYRMESRGAEVLEKEADGNPIFFRHRYGKGLIYTLALPLEKILVNHSGLLDRGCCEIYRSVLSPERIFKVESPFLTVTEHWFSDTEAAVVLVNNRSEALEETLHCAWQVTGAYSDSPAAVYENGVLKLPANAGILLTVRKS